MKLVETIKQLEDMLGRFGNMDLCVCASEDSAIPVSGFLAENNPWGEGKVVYATYDGW